jgi:hypothetical protein
MPEPRRLIATIIVSLMAAGACSPTASPPASTSPTPSTGSASIAPVPSDLPSPSPATSVAPTSAPPATSQILVRGSARELSENAVLMAPTRDGRLYVEVPSRAPGSTVLTRFDSEGRSAPGWPVTLAGATYCAAPMPVADGSVRMLCTLQNTTGGQDSGRAFAFDDSGRALPGWPVEIDDPVVTGRLIGDSLRVLANVAIDTEDEESPAEWFLLSIDAAGVTTNGVVMPKSECCPMVAIGPDGAAYAVTPGFPSATRSQITAFDMDGVLPRFPTAVVGVASGVSFDADGNIWVLSAHPADRTSRVLMVFDTGSVPLPFAAADPATDQTGGCESTAVLSPLMPSDRNGLIVEYSDVDETIFAVNRNLDTAKGWPFTLPDPLVHPRPGAEFEHEAGYCPGPLAPIVGPDGTVYLALQAHRSSRGGSLVAVGPDGRVRAGWPVGLKRAGAEFWSIAVGPDKTVYAIAYEPAAGGTSTATVLAIAPDSTIVYRTTIIAPA